MMIHDDIYSWKGWGGKLQLGSGRCRLRIYDLSKGNSGDVTYLRPIVVIVSDMPLDEYKFNQMSVKSCAGHIATNVVRDFNIDPSRMRWIEYYPADKDQRFKYSKESFDTVEFTWHKSYAINPVWRNLKPAMLEIVKELINEPVS